MPANTAAWLGARHAKLELKAAPYSPPGANEIVVRNHAVAVNPLDWIIQVAGGIAYRWIKYPFILGTDLAGEVVEVGEAVTRFQVGDRVLAHAVGSDKDRNSSAEGAFQAFTVVMANMAAPIPAAVSYEHAAVVPLGLSTAASSLFQMDQMALQHPSLFPKSTGETLLVWGGSSSVGGNAIQLAVAAGYEVITTCSPQNFNYVKKLGAAQAFDYHSDTVIDDVVRAFSGKALAGALAVTTGSAQRCADVVRSCEGNRFISMASPAVSFARLADSPGATRIRLPILLLQLVSSTASLQARCRLRGIRAKFVFGSSLKGNEISKVIYEEFLPAALAAGTYVTAPEPYVVGHGLENLQGALEIQMRGVSAQKVVITLPSSQL
jgi:NADPH:quinone reductase-like Zn-dependent oxidoreductase